HPWPVIVVAVLIMIGVTVANQIAGGTYSDDFDLTGTESAEGTTLLEQHAVIRSGNSAWIVFAVDSGQLSSHHDAIEQAVKNLDAVDHVITASAPLSDATTPSTGRLAGRTGQLDHNPGALGDTFDHDIDDAVRPARAADVDLDYTGPPGQAAEPAADDRRS